VLFAVTQLTTTLSAGILATMRVAEAPAPASTNPVEYLLQYGPLGLMVLGFLTGWIVPGYHAKSLEAENRRLTALFEGKLLPMIETTVVALDKATSAMEKSAAALERVRDEPRRRT
jgi:hypothetical protein